MGSNNFEWVPVEAFLAGVVFRTSWSQNRQRAMEWNGDTNTAAQPVLHNWAVKAAQSWPYKHHNLKLLFCVLRAFELFIQNSV